MASGNKSNGGGINVGILGLLGVAFVVLKLCGVIDWHWAWVTAPFWGPFAAAAVVLAIGATIAGTVGVLTVLRGMHVEK